MTEQDPQGGEKSKETTVIAGFTDRVLITEAQNKISILLTRYPSGELK